MQFPISETNFLTLHPWTKMFSDMGLGAVIFLSIQPYLRPAL